MLAYKLFEEHIKWSHKLFEEHIQWSRKIFDDHIKWSEEYAAKRNASAVSSSDSAEPISGDGAPEKSNPADTKDTTPSKEWIENHIQESKAHLEGFIQSSRECLENIVGNEE